MAYQFGFCFKNLFLTILIVTQTETRMIPSPFSPFSQSPHDDGFFGQQPLFPNIQNSPSQFPTESEDANQWGNAQPLSPNIPQTQSFDPRAISATFIAYQQQQQQQQQQEQQQINELQEDDPMTIQHIVQTRSQQLFNRDVVSFIQTLGDLRRTRGVDLPRDELLSDGECKKVTDSLRAVLDSCSNEDDRDSDEDDNDENDDGTGTPRNSLTPGACQQLFDTFLRESQEYLRHQEEQLQQRQQPTVKRQREHTDIVSSEIVDVADKRMRASGDWCVATPGASPVGACPSPPDASAMDDALYSGHVASSAVAPPRVDDWLHALSVPSREERQHALGGRDRGAPKAEHGEWLLSGPCPVDITDAAALACLAGPAEADQWLALARTTTDAREVARRCGLRTEGARQTLQWLACDTRGRLDAPRLAQLAGLLYTRAPFGGHPGFAVHDFETLRAWPGFHGFCSQTQLAEVLRACPAPCCCAAALLPENRAHGVLTVAWKRPDRAGRARLRMDHIAMLRADQAVRLHADATHAATLRRVEGHLHRVPAAPGLARDWTEAHPSHGFYSVASGPVFVVFANLRALLESIAFPPVPRPRPFVSSLAGMGVPPSPPDYDSSTMR